MPITADQTGAENHFALSGFGQYVFHLTFPTAPTNGSQIIAGIWWNSGLDAIVSVSDTIGQAWSHITIFGTGLSSAVIYSATVNPTYVSPYRVDVTLDTSRAPAVAGIAKSYLGT